MFRIVFVAGALMGAAVLHAAMPDVQQINCPGTFTGHLQDVCTDGEFLYWAHTVAIVKSDLTGKQVARVEVPEHNAGIAALDGLLYVAVCPLADLDHPKQDYPVQVWIYDAKTLALKEKKVLPQKDRAGSLAVTPNGFIVGCLRGKNLTKRQVRVHLYDRQFKYIESRIIECPRIINLGTEVIKYRDGHYWFAMYPDHVQELDEHFNTVASYKAQGQTGMIFDGQWYWYGVTWSKDGKHQSCIRRQAIPKK
ncbi:MAG: hypothetical protein IJR99_09100 [Kiritimatiellae bacterium]|nr:hypothetical protein [Kiritimatiellia bacterium]